jgi:hypothetical protein
MDFVGAVKQTTPKLIVGGTVVATNANTVFQVASSGKEKLRIPLANFTAEDLKVGDAVEVTGGTRADGSVLAQNILLFVPPVLNPTSSSSAP